jgi:hypothetical protein
MKQVKILSSIVTICVAALAALTIAIMAFLPKISLIIAQSYTAEAHMRVPVLIQLEIALGFFAIICLLGLNVLRLAAKGRMYSSSTAKTLKLIALSFLCISVLQIVFVFYVISQVEGSITNLYSLFISFGCLGAAALFMLLSCLTVQGTQYKQDSELAI